MRRIFNKKNLKFLNKRKKIYLKIKNAQNLKKKK